MTNIFLSIQGSYTHLELAVFNGDKCLRSLIYDDAKASSSLIPYLDDLLKQCSLTLSDIQFITLDKGPGAFTSLRVTITTVNGIAFALGKPLIGVNGLFALHWQARAVLAEERKMSDLLVSILNAYNNDVYYLVKDMQDTNVINESSVMYGCNKVNTLFEELSSLLPKKSLAVAGNGLSHYQQHIYDVAGPCIEVSGLSNATASANYIGMIGWQLWQQKKSVENKIVPNYLKNQLFAVSR